MRAEFGARKITADKVPHHAGGPHFREWAETGRQEHRTDKLMSLDFEECRYRQRKQRSKEEEDEARYSTEEGWERTRCLIEDEN